MKSRRQSSLPGGRPFRPIVRAVLFFGLVALFCVVTISSHPKTQHHILNTASQRRSGPQNTVDINTMLSGAASLVGDDDDDSSCDDVLSDAYPDKCAFVTANCTDSGGIINYLSVHFCLLGSVPVLSYIFQVIWIVYMFSLLGTTASDYFVPALTSISELLHLSPNVAGGNGAPDVFSMIAGGSQDAFLLSLSEGMGSGLCIITVIFASVGLVSPFTIDKALFLDAAAYLVCVAFMFGVVMDSKITWVEALMLPILYIAYVSMVVIVDLIRRRRARYTAIPDHDPAAGVNNSDVGTSAAPSAILEVTPVMLPIGGTDKPLISDVDPSALPWGRKAWAGFVEWLQWAELGRVGKVRALVELPFSVARWLTIPALGLEASTWTRIILNAFCSSLFIYWAMGCATTLAFGVLPGWSLALILGGLLVAPLCMLNRPKARQHRLVQFFFTAWVFLVAVLWLNSLANELVAVLQALGVLMGLSDALIGATFLAWGNCVGDFVADIAVAREGQPMAAVAAVLPSIPVLPLAHARATCPHLAHHHPLLAPWCGMAVCAQCFASPLLNCLLGLGIASLITLINHKFEPISWEGASRLPVMLIFGFLFGSLLLSFVVLPLCKRKVSKPFSIAQLVLYVVFTVLMILAEVGVLGAVY
ncbi:Ca2+:Cation Antiporter [Paratrimastix pyriformis]|uniref:Ca2+:Cation Antiporter n=1 Tax=Paratrimastix pyriformis TaxID=342808 RepID=A0ABQ8UZ17_9EUKA|nr:Ca2+:Cation Antiporter [Paratrimastix pyriformis]